MNKGEITKSIILKTGLDMASRLGLENVTIGALAKAAQLSKSGLFAHFQSKENLQVEILDHAAELFWQNVVAPALKTEAGVARIEALVWHWVRWGTSLTGGCIFVSASSDFSDRPGRVRDVLLKQQQTWLDSLQRMALSAVKVGDFRPEIDAKQFAFDLYSLLLGVHLYFKLLNDEEIGRHQKTALDRLIDNYR
jgi:AcrR family transcriptional regulator